MNDPHQADSLLDEIAQRIRNNPVPRYPGPPDLTALSGPPTLSIRTSATRGRRSVTVAVVCALAALGVVLILVTNRETPSAVDDRIAEQSATPIRVTTVDVKPELDAMIRQLDVLDRRLDQLEALIALHEVQSEAETLLAEYTLQQNDSW